MFHFQFNQNRGVRGTARLNFFGAPGPFMNHFELISFPGPDQLALAAANAWLDEIAALGQAGRSHCVALSGGRIARTFFTAIVDRARARAISFDRVHFFWADDRCVPPSDPENNSRIARELLFAPLGIAESQVHRIRGEDPPETAAAAAETEIRRVIAVQEAGQPVLDLVFLGMGADGHVASLFPGEPEEVASSPAVYRAVSNSPKPPPNRVTLGYPAVAAARQAWMLASGTGKEAALHESLTADGKTPFGRVLRLRRHTRIFTDIAVERLLV